MKQVGDEILRIENAVLSSGKLRILSDVTLSVRAGDIVSVSGPNGAGKTTLLKTSVNLLAPSSGQRTGPRKCRYVPAGSFDSPLTVDRWLRSMPRVGDLDSGEALEVLGFDTSTKIQLRHLSFGNFRKVLLAEALTSGRCLVAIDETLEGLDAQGREGLAYLLARQRESGSAVLLVLQEGYALQVSMRQIHIKNGLATENQPTSGTQSHPEFCTPTYSGPVKNLTQLDAAARQLGFSRSSSDQ